MSTATVMLPLPVLLLPARRPLMLPVPLAAPVLAPNVALRFSLKAPAAAVLATVSAAELLPLTRWLATVAGLGVAAPAAALYAAAPAPSTMLSFWSAMLLKLLVRLSFWFTSGARAPALATVKTTPRSPLLLPGAPVL